MKQKIKVVMLPTEDITGIVLHSTGLDPFYTNNVKDRVDNLRAVKDIGGVSQYVYITESKDVIGGEEVYYIDKFTNKVTSSGGAEYGAKQDVVLATTDPKLVITTLLGPDGTSMFTKLPQLQQSFLKEYVANPDGEYEVEYLTGHSENRLKLNQDNTVNITSVEKKMYSREEVKSLLHRAVNDSHCTSNSVKQPNSNKCADFTINWISKNL